MAAILHKEPAPPDAPPVLQQIVRRCLMKAPAERFQTMAEVAQALADDVGVEEAACRSIAVLPFANMSGDKDNEYFSDGLAEEIINALAQIPGLKVTARTSAFAFRGKEQDIRKIGEALEVKTILEGSVRRAGNRIRVMAQLVSAQDGYHLWSQRYDREMADIFELQDEIAQAIARALQVELSGSTPLQHYKPNLPAYDALLRARYDFDRADPDSLRRARAAYEQAIALDPKFPLPYCEFGLYFWFMAASGLLPPDQALPAVRSNAQKVLELAPSIPLGHAMLGLVAGFFDLDWKEAARQFRLAMAREPVPPLVRNLYAYTYLVPVGRPAEALREVERALQEDPLNLSYRIPHAICLVALSRDKEALEEMISLRELTESSPAVLGIGTLHFMRGNLEDARRALEQVPFIPNAAGLLAAMLSSAGDTERAEETLQRLRADSFHGARARAVFHWACGDLDAAAHWWEKAIDKRDPSVLIGLRTWYGRDLRSTPHWARLMRKLNLPEA